MFLPLLFSFPIALIIARAFEPHVHTKALEARLMTEKSYREEIEQRGLLVDKGAIIELTRRTMDAVLRRLKKLPNEKGPECNPEHALMAVGILEAEVNLIIATGKKALDAFAAGRRNSRSRRMRPVKPLPAVFLAAVIGLETLRIVS